MSKSDGVVVFACEACGFVEVVDDPPKGRPDCKCGQPAKHVSPATYKRLTGEGQ